MRGKTAFTSVGLHILRNFISRRAGKITIRVFCKSDKTQKYTLYLPKDYNRNKKWSVIVCFDSAAREIVPVKLFEESSEKYGYIIITSNNSSNHAPQQTVKAINAIFKELDNRYSIDEKRVYTCGFSGGARVALEVAMMEPK